MPTNEPRRQPKATFPFAGGKPPPRHLTPQEIAEERRKKLCAKYEAFFAPIVEQLQAGGETGKLLNLMRSRDCNDRGFESRFPPLCFNLGFWGPNNGERHRPYVYLYIREPDGRRSRQIFDRLRNRHEAIERELRQINPSFELNQWSPTTGSPNPRATNYRSVGMMIHGTINDPPEKLNEISNWMLAFYPALKTTMDPHLEEILRDLP